MTRNPKKSLTVIGVVLVIILLVGYTLFQAKNLIRGPVLTIDEPKNNETVTYEVVNVKGRTENVAAITLNDSPIFIDKDGNFSEKVVVSPGYSVIKVSAKDRFDRVNTKYLNLIFKTNQTSISTSTPVATTTKI